MVNGTKARKNESTKIERHCERSEAIQKSVTSYEKLKLKMKKLCETLHISVKLCVTKNYTEAHRAFTKKHREKRNKVISLK
jgi:hypothetical protein